jgi:hypothetical protein
MARLAASQGEEADPVGVEIDLGSDQTIRPQRIDREAMTQQLDRDGAEWVLKRLRTLAR